MYRSEDEYVRNTTLFFERVGNHPERIQNLYLLYAFMARAVIMAE